MRNEISTEESIKQFLHRKLRSPFLIAGLILIFVFILISIAPQIFTPYTLLQAFQTQSGPYGLPSPEHPLGQTFNGYDVAAVIVYSIPTSLKLATLAVVISLAAGIFFGYLAGRFNLKVYTIIMAGMIFFYVLPTIVIAMVIANISVSYYHISSNFVLIISALLIPSFTRIIANSLSQKLDAKYLFKTVVCYIPLHFGLAILIIESIGYLGLFDPSVQTLSNLVNYGRINLSSAPWASLYPGVTIFGIVLSFFLLYIGLQDYGYTPRSFKVKFWRSKSKSESLGDMEK
ncbi:MAG: ABC transporter permease [Candidatus Odinarchaeota archaeon]